RRGASLLTLSGPEDDSVWTDDRGPKSASRPIEAAKAKSSLPAAKIENPHQSRYEPQEASLDLDQPAPLPSVPPLPGPPSRPPSSSRWQGEPRNLGVESGPSAAAFDLDLDLEPPPSRQSNRPKPSSLPPVLDPRAAGVRKSDGGTAPSSGDRSSERP